jgi:L-threonylcarbamoyladenylate synthase
VTEVLTLDARNPDPAGIARAAAMLRRGALVAFPTETVYGLGAHALDPTAVRRIFVAKERPAEDPLIVHVHDVQGLEHLTTNIPDVARTLAARFWPGPLTMVLRRSPAVPREVTAGLDTVAVRVPAHPIAHALIAAAGVPVAAPSANLFSRPSPTRAGHVLEDLNGRIDLLIDGGPTTVGVESTVIDLTADPPMILRPGAVTLDMIQDVVPAAAWRRTFAQGDGAMASPGMLEKHYSPRAPLTLYDGNGGAVTARLAADAAAAMARGQRVGIITSIEDPLSLESQAVHVERLGSEHDAPGVAAHLYDALRRLDAGKVDLILARSFRDLPGLGVAVHDRLRRAAAGRVIHVE